MKKIISIGVLSAITWMCAAPASAIVLTGNYIQLGVGNNGTLGDHGGSFTGLKFDPTGMGNFGGIDFLSQANPFSFYSVGINGAHGVAGGGASGNPFGATTVDLSDGVGFPLGVTKNGSYAGLAFKQVLFFDADSKTIHASVTFTNKSAGALQNVDYAFGLNTAQDHNVNGSDATVNRIYGEGVHADVGAFGAASGAEIRLKNTSGWDAKASITPGLGDTNPDHLARNIFNAGNGDNTLDLAYDLGNFAVGQQKTVAYDLIVTTPPVPEPETYAMMLAGLVMLRFLARSKRKDDFAL